MDKWDMYIKSITSAVDRTNYLYEKWAKRQSINSYVSQIMYMLYASGINKQKDIVENYGFPKQTVNTVISELLKKEYILLEPDPTDRRSKMILLTDAGIKYAEELVTPLLKCEKNVLAEMGEERVKLLIDTIKQYADLLEKEMNN